jgi:DNA-binding MarR family transcriptional regulator
LSGCIVDSWTYSAPSSTALAFATSTAFKHCSSPTSAEEIAIRDLVERGYYQGSNVSYNIKKLAEMGYLDHQRSTHDRRSVSIRLTQKALGIVDQIRELELRIAGQLGAVDVGSDQIDAVCQALRLVERTWTDYVHYGRA